MEYTAKRNFEVNRMRAQNLSICIPNYGCNKNCPYCVSNMTGMIRPAVDRLLNAVTKVESFASRIGVTTVLFTGKGEPLFNEKSIRVLAQIFKKRFRSFIIELQTNGLAFLKPGGKDLLRNLRLWGLNVLAVSIDRFSDFERFGPIFSLARQLGLVVRVAANAVYDMAEAGFAGLKQACLKHGVQQLTIRRITVPSRIVNTPQALKTRQWIEEHKPHLIYETLLSNFAAEPKRLIRVLNYGAKVYDVDGLAFVASDYCIQENNHEEDIRSLILAEDGHCYDGWDCQASILF